MAVKTISNPQGAFGYTDLQTQLWFQPAEFEASADVAAKRVVAINTTGKVATAATNGTASLVVGISVDAVSSGDTGVIAVGGIAENVPADGAITAGAIVKRSTTTAGYVMATATPGAGEGLGVAISAAASNVVDVWIRPTALS